MWLVQIGEQLPIDPGPPRLIRTALLARELVARGHDVTFWNAGFIHQQKRHRLRTGQIFDIDDGYRVGLLRGRGYRRNISFARILSHQENARSFARMARGLAPPDVLLCGLPSIEIADAATRYARDHGVPVAVDCRDLWPDIIADQAGSVLRLAAAPVLAYWRRMLRRTMLRATAITGVSEGFVSWGVAAAGRPRLPLDKPFHLTVAREAGHDTARAAADRFWPGLLGAIPADGVIGVYAGSLSRRFDLLTIAEAVRQLPADVKSRLRIVICGEGDVESRLRQVAADEPSLIIPGWRSAAELQALMRQADFGILPYPSSRDFTITFPNKVGEYLSFGLPIMTGLDGVIGAMLAPAGLRLGYETGDVGSARDALTGIVTRKADLARLKESARRVFRLNFDPDGIYPAFADYLEELAGQRGRVSDEAMP